MIREGFGGESAARVRLVRGSHIVTRRLFEHDRAYIFQQADGRVVFAIPYEGDFTLIGTTDVEHDGAAGRGRLHAGGAGLPARGGGGVFPRAGRGGDIVWSYSGVRPLYDDGASSATAATRDYVIQPARGGGRGGGRRLRRQDHHLPAAFGGGAGEARGGLPGHGRAVDGAGAAAGRGLSGGRRGGAGARAGGGLSRSSMRPGRRGWCGATAPRRRRCWRARARRRTWASGSAGT